MKKNSRYIIDENDNIINKYTFKEINFHKAPYHLGISKTKQIAIIDIINECGKNYIALESTILKARKVLETKIIPFNI